MGEIIFEGNFVVGGNCPWDNFPQRNCPGQLFVEGQASKGQLSAGGGAIFLGGNCPITDFKEQRPGADICGN